MGVAIEVEVGNFDLTADAASEDTAEHDESVAATKEVATESAGETERMSTRRLSIEQAACVLGISPRTLLAWEERYGYPRSAEGHLLYRESDVTALREELEHGLSVSSAVSNARATTRRRRASA